MSDKAEVTFVNNGPIRITCEDMAIKDAAGNEFGLGGRTTISLCRCGFAANKPFCDGSHARQGFQSVVEARDLPPKPQA
jgi:CDGSH-type Zn-finger protein